MISRQIKIVMLIAASASAATATATEVSNTLMFGPFQRSSNPIEKLRLSLENLRSIPKIRHLTAENPYRTLTLKQKISTLEVETTKFQDYFKGIEVIGSQAMQHEGLNGVQLSDEMKVFDLDTTPTLSAEEAVGIARVAMEDLELKRAPELKIRPSEDGSARLSWKIPLKGTFERPGSTLFIDAHSGETLANLSDHIEAIPTRLRIAPVTIKAADDSCQLVYMIDRLGRLIVDRNGNPIPTQGGRPLIFLPERCKVVVTNSTPSATADASARRALANAKRTLEYYRGTHQQNSYDNQGANLVSVVHVGRKFGNAFWSADDKVMGYGDGDGVVMGDLTRAVDVAGHELTHGITSQTAELEHERESGALNEAFADYFGKMIANESHWIMGKAVFLDPASKGIRNLEDPHSLMVEYIDANGIEREKPYPKHVSEKIAEARLCDGSNDYCGVHDNSTIWSHGLYQVHKAIGKAKSEKLAFIALTQYLTPMAKFSSAKAAMLRACQQMYDPATCGKVSDAFAVVGL